MGRHHLAVGVVLGFLACKVWSGEPAAAREVVTVREARVPLEHITVIANTKEMGIREAEGAIEEVEEVEVIGRHFEGVLGEPADEGDGLTEDQRREGRIAEIEDGLSPNRAALHGQVRDDRSSEQLAGVTVIVQSPALANPQAAITDEHGFYEVTDLPPGNYVVTFYYLETTVERSGVAVTSGEAHEVSQRLLQTDQPPVVITLDAFPEGQGVSFTGIETMDNTYYVDEIDTTGLTFGDDE